MIIKNSKKYLLFLLLLFMGSCEQAVVFDSESHIQDENLYKLVIISLQEKNIPYKELGSNSFLFQSKYRKVINNLTVNSVGELLPMNRSYSFSDKVIEKMFIKEMKDEKCDIARIFFLDREYVVFCEDKNVSHILMKYGVDYKN